MDNHDNRNKLPNMSWDLSSSMEEQAAAHHQYHHHYQLPAHHPHHQHQQQQQQQQLLHNQQQQLLPFSPSAVWPNLFPLPFPSPSSSSTHVSFISSSSTHVSLPPPIPLNPYCFINPHQVQQKHDLQQQTSIKAVAGSAEDQVELVEQEEDQEQEDGEGEEDELEELGAMKEMMYKIAAMQPVDIDPATIRKPKRRNVRISDDPQSVAARHRRERISEKIRILQRLVPGGTKMDTASMLEEAVRYVKFLKREIRTLQQNNPPVSGTAAGGGDNNWQQQQGTVQLLGPSNTITTTIPSMEGRSSTNIIDQATSHGGQVVPLNISTFMINQG